MRAKPKPKRVKLPEEMRYMAPEHIAEDFRSKPERAAIAAVFAWLSLNSMCAWPLKAGRTSNHTSNASGRRRLVRSDPHQAIILTVEQLERAEKILGIRG